MDSERRNDLMAGRTALADFFRRLTPSKAHWYAIIQADNNEGIMSLMHSTFPALSELLSLDDAEWSDLLVDLGLAYYWRGTSCTPLIASWERFIGEYQLKVEVTHFKIGTRQRLFLQIGSWNEKKHPAKKPAEIWSTALNMGYYDKPKLRISSLSMRFASAIADLEFEHKDRRVCMSETIAVSAEEEEESEETDDACMKAAVPAELVFNSCEFSSQEYPLLHSLSSNTNFYMDALIREVVKFNDRKAIKYVQGNNRSGFLVPFSSCRSSERYILEFGKRGSAMDELVDILVSSMQCTKETAAECLFLELFNKFEDVFVKVAMDKGVMPNPSTKMDIEKVEAMLCDTGLNTKNSRILFQHLNQFFGHSFFESEKKRRDFFQGQDFPPTVDRLQLADKTIINYWYKVPDELIKHQLGKIIKPDQLLNLKRVDFTVGGDHGGGKFRVTLKLLLRYHDKKSYSRLFQIASVSHSKDDIDILKATVLNPIGEGLKRIVEGQHLSAKMVDNNFIVDFAPGAADTICDVNTRVLVVGDLKFYAQILGRENMSSYWCMWCNTHPSTWPDLSTCSDAQLWTIDKMVEHRHRINQDNIKEPREICGIVDFPLWDFIQPFHYVFPQLHVEIGLINNVLDHFYDFVEEQVEAPTPEERLCRNNLIICDVAAVKAKEKLDEWKESGASDLAMQRYSKSLVTRALKARGMSMEERQNLTLQQIALDNTIAGLVAQRKHLEQDISQKRKKLTEARAKFKDVRTKKKKGETPILAELENILMQHNINAAAYHGGKLNGVDCREFVQLSHTIYQQFEIYLLSTNSPNRCCDADIMKTCALFRDVCVTLDSLASKLRLKHGEPTEEDYVTAEKALQNLEYMWKMANLSFTPKIHCLLAHAIHQMRYLEGFGDTLEDDVEHMHQISARIEARVSRMKDKDRQAFVHSKMEAIQFNAAVTETIQGRKEKAARNFKKRNMELCASTRAAKMKKERDEKRTETLIAVEEKPHDQLITLYEKEKAEMLK